MRKLLVYALLLPLAFAQDVIPPRSQTGGVGTATFASPPSSPQVNQAYLFTDASATGVCSGGGTAYALCVWNGSAFVAVAGASSGLGDPGANSIPFRNGAGTSVPASADKMSGPNFCQDAGGSDTYSCNLSPVPAAYVTGTLYWFKANTNNTAAATINLNSKGALPLKKILGSISLDVLTGDILAGQWVAFLYDGTNAQIVSGLGSSVDTNSVQSLTNKTIDGVSPTTMAFVDLTSSAQTQLNSKQASLGFTPVDAASKDQANGVAGLDAGTKILLAEIPTGVEKTANKDGVSGYAGLDSAMHVTLGDLALTSNNCLPYRDNTGTLNQFCAGSASTGQFIGVNGSPLQFTWLTPAGSGGSGGGSVNYTVTTTASATEDKKLTQMNGSAISYTLASTPPSATWSTTVMNFNATDLIIGRNGTTINGQAQNITLHQGQRSKIDVASDGANYNASIPDTATATLTATCTLTGCIYQVNSAAVPTIPTLLQGDNTNIFSTDGTPAYTGCPLSGLSSGILKTGFGPFWLNVTTSSITSATINVCGTGNRALKLGDGATDVGASIQAGTGLFYEIMYDGTVFRTIGLATSGANVGLTNLVSPVVNANLGASSGVQAGTTTNPFKYFIFNGSGTYGTGSFRFIGTPTANRDWTVQDAADTFVGRATTDTLTNKTLTNPSLGAGSSPVTFTCTAGSGGTGAGLLVKWDGGNPGKCIIATTADNGLAIGVAMTSVSANATFEVAIAGVVGMVTNNSTTAGHIMILSTGTNGRVEDSGITNIKDTAINQGIQVIGTALANASASGNPNVLLAGFPRQGANNNQLNGTNFTVNTSGAVTKLAGITAAGIGVAPIVAVSAISNSSAVALVTLATAPGAFDYEIHYSLDLHTACTTGSEALTLTFAWTGNSSRSLTTNPWSIGAAQTTGGILSGVLPIKVASGDVTFTPSLNGTACTSGTATWDGQIWLVRVD